MYQIIWTPDAIKSYSDALSFIAENSSTYANKIIDEVERMENRLSQYPFIGGKIFEYPEKNIRKVTILSDFSLIYRVFDDLSIYVIYFWDNRQDPEKLATI